MKRSRFEIIVHHILNRPFVWFVVYASVAGVLLYYILCASFHLPVVFLLMAMALVCALALATLRAIPEILISRETERFSREPCVARLRQTLNFVEKHPYLYSDASERALNQAFCLRYEGRFEEAAEILEVSGFPRKTSSEFPFFFCGTYAEILFCQGRSQECSPYLEQMNLILDTVRGEKRDRMVVFYSRLEAERLLAQGAAQEALDLLATVHRSEDPPLTRLSDRWLKGRCLTALGRTDEALRELDAVICEGNDLCFVSQAREAEASLSHGTASF